MQAIAESLVVYGAGGHGRVVSDAAQQAGLTVIGFLDDGVPAGAQRDGLSVLGGLEWLSARAGHAVALGVGDNRTRERLAARIHAAGGRLLTVVHPRACVSRHARLGEGSVVLAQAVLNSGAVVGGGAIINTGAIVEHDATVGDFAHVAPRAALAGAARVGQGAFVGTGASVLVERVLGEWSILGAGAVLVKNIPAQSVAVGVPARVIRPV